MRRGDRVPSGDDKPTTGSRARARTEPAPQHDRRARDLAGARRRAAAALLDRPATDFGRRLGALASHLYAGNVAAHELWEVTLRELAGLDQRDRVARFNAKRFLCFQLAKILDTLQNPLRKTYQSLLHDPTQSAVKGPYPIFDNVTAIFSATPVITRTATYMYACTEWVEDAFKGREPLHEIYSRLLNPTSISLANHIVDLEAGPLAGEYLAWNFNSGMAAIDATLANLVGYQRRRARRAATSTAAPTSCCTTGTARRATSTSRCAGSTASRSRTSRRALARDAREQRRPARRRAAASTCSSSRRAIRTATCSTCPAICRAAHESGLTVICDATVGTPILQPVLQRDDPMERPDFVIHSYTKDLAGSGTTTAGVCIGRNERMFIPKGDTRDRARARRQAAQLSLGREPVLERVLREGRVPRRGQGVRGDQRHAHASNCACCNKCINTLVLARALARHPAINVRCSAVEGNENYALRERLMFLGLPAPLFTIDFEHRAGPRIGRACVPALLRLPRARVRPAGDARPGQHGGALPGADEPLGAVGRGAARGGHLADDDPHRRSATRIRARCSRT